MKRLALLFAVLLVLTNAAVTLAAVDVTPYIEQAVTDLKIEKNDPRLLALTNAPYVSPDGKKNPESVDVIQTLTGCSMGKGNLLFFQRPRNSPLLIALSREDNGETVVIKYDGKGVSTFKFNIRNDTAADPKNFGAIQKQLKGDTFSVVTLLTSHAKGAPYDFMKCCEYHNHYCPGITSGYLIAKYIEKHYPAGPGQRYIWFACPPWCKDDAVSSILDLTPGKGNLFVKNMAEGRSQEGPDGRFAGIMVRWNGAEKKGKAVVLEFDWNEVYRLAGIKAEDLSPKGGKSNPAFFTVRVLSSWALIPYLNQPERFIKTFKTVDIDAKTLKRMKAAGTDPYQVVGVAK